MKLLPLLSTLLLGAGALHLPRLPEPVASSSRPLSVRAILKRLPPTRGGKAYGTGEGIQPEDVNAAKANKIAGNEVLAGTEEDVDKAVLKAQGDTKEFVIGELAEDPPIGPGKKSNEVTGWRTTTDKNGKPTRLDVYFGKRDSNGNLHKDVPGPEGHAHHINLSYRTNKFNPFKPPMLRKATPQEKAHHRKILDEIKKVHGNTGDGKVLDEKLWASIHFYSFQLDGSDAPDRIIQTVFILPAAESALEARLMTHVSNFEKKNPGVPIYIHPNIDFETSQYEFSPGSYVYGPKVDYMKHPLNPLIENPTDGDNFKLPTNDPYVTAYTPQPGEHKRSLAESIFAEMKKQKRQLGPMSSGQNPDNTNAANTDLETTVAGAVLNLQGTQNQITDLIWPTLVNLTAGLNTPEMSLMALSLFSDLTGAQFSIMGPYSMGLNLYSGMEKPTDSPLQKLAYATMIESYETAWENASALVNGSVSGSQNLTGDLAVLNEIMNINASVIPSSADLTQAQAQAMFAPFTPNTNATYNTSLWLGLNATYAAALGMNSTNATSLLSALNATNTSNSASGSPLFPNNTAPN